MEVLLGVKVGCLLALLVLTMGCGLTPIYVKWFQMDAATGIAPTLTLSLTLPYLRPGLTSVAVCRSSFIPIYLTANWRLTSAFLLGHHHRVLSLLGCTSAGVFLGAGLMHMTAEALEGIESEIQRFVVQVGSKEIKWWGYGAVMIDAGDIRKAQSTAHPVGQQLLSRSGGGGGVEHPRKESLLAERAGQERELPQTQSDFCFCLPRIVQEVRGILLVMLLLVT